MNLLQYHRERSFGAFRVTLCIQRSASLSQVNDIGMLQSYYYAAYNAVRKHSDCFVAISPREWEQDGAAWQFFMTKPPYTKVIQDLHRRVSATV